MALPPEPLGELLFSARYGIQGGVVAILEVGPPVPTRSMSEGPGPIADDPWQLVRIEVRRVVFGTPPAGSLVAYKPVAPYSLRVGEVENVFLLGGETHHSFGAVPILGRYGPFYELEEVEAGRAAMTPRKRRWFQRRHS